MSGSGALQAHYLLWVDPADVQRVKNDISGSIPAEWNKQTEEFVSPIDEDKELLLHTDIIGICITLAGHRAAERQQQISKKLEEWGCVKWVTLGKLYLLKILGKSFNTLALLSQNSVSISSITFCYCHCTALYKIR